MHFATHLECGLLQKVVGRWRSVGTKGSHFGHWRKTPSLPSGDGLMFSPHSMETVNVTFRCSPPTCSMNNLPPFESYFSFNVFRDRLSNIKSKAVDQRRRPEFHHSICSSARKPAADDEVDAVLPSRSRWHKTRPRDRRRRNPPEYCGCYPPRRFKRVSLYSGGTG